MDKENTHYLKWLLITIFIYIIVFSFFSVWKYNNFYYNALDLAIYNQVFYNSALGQLFHFTIHPHSFLGDHLAFITMLILPFYWLWRTPGTLLVLQTVFLGLSAWPLWLIARLWLKAKWAFFISGLFLLSSFIHSINLFEFHEIGLAFLFLFFLFYFYQVGRFKLFILFIFLSLLIREDVALVILAFSFLAIIEKRKIKWFLAPFLSGLFWLMLSYQLTTYFSGYPSYKFLTYFSWMGKNPTEILINFFTNPLVTLVHIFTWENLFLALGLLLPFLFIPLLKPKYLILSLPYFIIFLLVGFGKMFVLNSHYLVFLTFGVWLSFTAGLARLDKLKKSRLYYLVSNKNLLVVVLLAITLYSSITFGPLYGMIKKIIINPDRDKIAIQRQLTALVPKDASLLAGYNTITNLSGRTNLYLNRYIFLGKKQYSDQPFPEPEKVDYVLLDSQDFLVYQLQYSHDENYQSGPRRERDFIKKQNLETIECLDSFILMKKNGKAKKEPYRVLDLSEVTENGLNITINRQIDLLDYQIGQRENNILPLSLSWRTNQKLDQDYQLYVEYLDSSQNVLDSRLYATAYGLLPTSDWPIDNVVKTNYWLLLPAKYQKEIQYLRVSLASFSGYFGLSDILSGEIKDLKIQSLEPKITIAL